MKESTLELTLKAIRMFYIVNETYPNSEKDLKKQKDAFDEAEKSYNNSSRYLRSRFPTFKQYYIYADSLVSG